MNVIQRNVARKLDKCLLQCKQWKISGRSITNAGDWVVFNMKDRMDAMRIELKPPVGNKMLHNGELQIMFVGGPNHRTDFHLEHGQVMMIGNFTSNFAYNFCNNTLERIGAFHSIRR